MKNRLTAIGLVGTAMVFLLATGVNQSSAQSISLRLIRTLDSSVKVKATALSRDGKTLATATGGTVTFWDLVTGGKRSLTLLDEQNATVSALEFSADGKTLLTASSGVDVRNQTESVTTCSGLSCQISQTTTSVTMAFGSVIQLWTVDSGKPINVWGLGSDNLSLNIQSLEMSVDGKTVMSNDLSGEVKVWEFSTGRKLREIGRIGNSRASEAACSQMTAMDPINDGRFVRQGGTAIESWLPEQPSVPLAISNSDERDLAFQTAAKAAANSCLAFSPDGKTVAWSVSDAAQGDLYLWQTTGAQRYRLLNTAGKMTYSALAFSPDNQRLIVGTQQGLLLLWSMTNGQEIGRHNVGSGKRISFLRFLNPRNVVSVSGSAASSKIEIWGVN